MEEKTKNKAWWKIQYFYSNFTSSPLRFLALQASSLSKIPMKLYTQNFGGIDTGMYI